MGRTPSTDYQIGERELKQQFLGKLPAEMTGGKPRQPASEILGGMEKLVAGMNRENPSATQAELQVALHSLKKALGLTG